MKSFWNFKKYNKRETAVSYICLSPALVLAVVFIVIPLLSVFILSFSNWDMVKNSGGFTGLKNYAYIFKDTKFIKSMLNTLYFAGIKIPLDLVLALFFATLLDKQIKGRRFFRAAYFMPVVVPMVAAAIIWIWLYNPSIGPLNQIIGFLGIRPAKWLYDPNLSMLCIIAFSLWKGLGYNIVILLAGLQAIPETYIEAARIDGATPGKIFFKITLPLLSPIVYFVILMGFVNSFKVFTQISVMTPKGGPLYSTGVMVFYIYEQAFMNYKLGRASSASVILFFMILIITYVQKQIGKKTVHYN